VSDFVSIEVEPGPAAADGVSLRFKRVSGVEERAPRDIPYESEGGVDGRWRVLATDDADAASTRPARALLVEDSSDGSAWLIEGGAHGLVLEHEPSGARVREPYLVLSRLAL
jgi:hypothetical protein